MVPQWPRVCNLYRGVDVRHSESLGHRAIGNADVDVVELVIGATQRSASTAAPGSESLGSALPDFETSGPAYGHINQIVSPRMLRVGFAWMFQWMPRSPSDLTPYERIQA